MNYRTFFIMLLLPVIYFIHPLMAEETLIYMNSENGDKVGQNESYALDEKEGQIIVKAIQPPLSKNIKGFSITYHHPKNDSWQFKFVVPNDESIVLNKTYYFTKAYPYHSASSPAMKATPLKDDYLELRGTFKIIDYKLDNDGNVLSLAINFNQIANNKGYLSGAIRYYSSVEVNLDPPSPSDENNEQSLAKTNNSLHIYTFGKTRINDKKTFVNNGSLTVLAQEGFYSYVKFTTLDKLELKLSFAKSFKCVYFKEVKKNKLYINPSSSVIGFDIRASDTSGPSILNKTTWSNLKIKVIDVEFYGDTMKSFAIDFFVEGNDGFGKITGDGYRGSLRYNSSIPPSTEKEIIKNTSS